MATSQFPLKIHIKYVLLKSCLDFSRQDYYFVTSGEKYGKKTDS